MPHLAYLAARALDALRKFAAIVLFIPVILLAMLFGFIPLPSSWGCENAQTTSKVALIVCVVAQHPVISAFVASLALPLLVFLVLIVWGEVPEWKEFFLPPDDGPPFFLLLPVGMVILVWTGMLARVTYGYDPKADYHQWIWIVLWQGTYEILGFIIGIIFIGIIGLIIAALYLLYLAKVTMKRKQAE